MYRVKQTEVELSGSMVECTRVKWGQVEPGREPWYSVIELSGIK